MYRILIKVNDVSDNESTIMHLIDVFKRHDIDPKDSLVMHRHGPFVSKHRDPIMGELVDMLKYGHGGYVEHWITHSFDSQLVHQIKYNDERRDFYSYAFIVETPNEMIAVELKLALGC